MDPPPDRSDPHDVSLEDHASGSPSRKLSSPRSAHAPVHRGSPRRGIPDIALIIHRVDLFDSGHSEDDLSALHQQPTYYVQPSQVEVGGFYYRRPTEAVKEQSQNNLVIACRVPPHTHPSPVSHRILPFPVVDNTIPNPYGCTVEKYWYQRRRLFSRFDEGIQLDEEGWFSVTPEQIADHVAFRLSDLILASSLGASQYYHQTCGIQRPIILLDAFCGCGGNAVAFARQPNIVVYAVDTDRTKLKKAAHNASIYQIQPNKLFFIECNVLFILEYCFRDGVFVLDEPIETPEEAAALMQSMPPPVPTESYAGYSIGGIDMLPRGIDTVFMDPPWGGVDYEVFGKHGYDLEKNMKIKRPQPSVAKASAGTLVDGFFDSFVTQPRSKKERISQFNCTVDEEHCVNGAELLALAAASTATRWVIYDVPKNTSHKSLGHCALMAGYRGNCMLEEHYINGRLKTMTAYFGTDWRGLLNAGTLNVSSWNV